MLYLEHLQTIASRLEADTDICNVIVCFAMIMSSLSPAYILNADTIRPSKA